jgi:phosphonoacetate hydrolase
MSAKHDDAGAPRIVFIAQLLRDAGIPARVVLPITDAHVVHHGALGGFATVHVGAEHVEGAADRPFGDGWSAIGSREVLPPGLEISMDLGAAGGGRFARLAGGGARRAALIERAAELLRKQPGVLRVLPRALAAAVYELPEDRVGDLVVVSDEQHVLGKSADAHDLSQVAFLRSHGGESELAVPLLLSRVPSDEGVARRLAAGEARSFELLPLLFELAAEAAEATVAEEE